ncbi:MAG: T9SS type A sorting domain-containing protein [Bacteroidetes bacterium]|jgi:hypothetical protein|nr:T9SS type A sorting domain-containing protein [Bacteroidota bacterium]MBT6686187.1 T9SS type A sorting domain-containing protein [Bacteroidota bacterium]MBT7143898.1 T9SS type A sorting domain-containing protein [Bacteroidota bacterium]
MKKLTLKKLLLLIFVISSTTAIFAQPNWNLSLVTGSNHTILVQPGTITINGSAISVGDYIGVFFDSTAGTLACGGFHIWDGNSNAITAWGADAGMDGFAANEAFKWKIWQASTGATFDATATYMTVGMPNQGNFVSNGISGLADLSATGSIPLSISLSGTDVACFGDATGAVDLTVSGGDTPYLYIWSNSTFLEDLTNLVAGTYTVTVFDNSSTSATESIIISQPTAAITISNPVVTDVTFYGGSDGSISLLAMGGTTPFTFLWSNGSTLLNQTNLVAGTYDLTITDANGCTEFGNYVVDQPVAPPQLIVNYLSSDVSCFGGSDGSIDLTVSGGTTPYCFDWSNGLAIEDITGLIAGTYTVTVTDNCTSQPFSWTYIVTSGNHTILLQPGTITINSQVLAVGDYVGVFYDQGGTLACGGYAPWTGSNTAVTAWGSEAGLDNGFQANEAFVWKVWQASSGQVVDMTPTYQTLGMPNQGNFATNGISGIASLSGTSTGGGTGTTEIVTITIIEPAEIIQTDDVSICDGDSYYAGGALQTTSGSYTDVYTATNGCDSTVNTNLTVNQIYNETVNVAICDGESFFAGGANQTIAGTYTDVLTSIEGCDSTIITNLTVNPVYTETINMTICDGESYFAGGANQTVAGVYTDVYTTINGCDSTIITNLTVNPVYAIMKYIEICDNETYYAGGAFQSTTGVYVDNYTTINGCDSIVTTNLTVYPTYSLSIDTTICGNETYFAGGANQNTTGFYMDVLTSINGCDSIVSTNLTVNPVYSQTFDISICDGDFYFAGGAEQTTSGTYTDYLFTGDGCDSTVITNLTVNSVYSVTFDISICDGESYYAGGANQTMSGTYTDNLLTVNGCDSTVITNLTVNPVYTQTFDVEICDGEIYFAGGADQTVTGTYTDVLTTINSCDSTIITNLTVNPIYTTNVDVEICEGETYFVAGADQTVSGIYTDILTTIDGCDSTILTNLTVNPVFTETVDISICSGETYFAAGANQSVSGVYADVYTTINNCDSTIITNLTVNPVYSETVIAAICDGETYFAGGADQTVSGTYTDVFASIDGCDSTIITNLTVNQNPIVGIGGPYTISYPNAVAMSTTISGGSGSYSYSWTPANLFVDASAQNPTTIDSIETTTTVSLTVTDINTACETIEQVDIQIIGGPLLVSVMANPSTVCAGDLVQLTTIVSGGLSANYTYIWSDGGSFSSTDANPTDNPIASVVYSVSVSDGTNTTVETVSVTVNPLPVVDLGADMAICDGGSYLLDAGNAGASFVWSNGSTDQNINVTMADTYFVTVTDANMCVNTDDFVLTVNALPTVDLGADAAICDGQSFPLDAGNAGVSFIWSNGATDQNISVTMADTYTVTVTDANNCENTDDFVLTVNPLPVVDLGADQEICDGESITIDAVISGVYLWSNGETTQTISATLTDLYSVSVTDANSCVGTDDVQLTVNALPSTPAISASGATTFCEGNSVTLSAPSGYNYLWSNGEITESIMVSTSGDFSVVISDQTTNCESAVSAITTVLVNVLPIVDLGADAAICDGVSYTLDAGNAGASFIWSNGATDQSISVSMSDTYTVTVTDANSCENTDDFVLTVNSLPNVDLGADQTICEGNSINLDAVILGTYLWSTTETTQIITVSTASNYAVTLTDMNGCVGSDDMDLTVNPLPVVDLGADTTICQGNAISLHAGSGWSYYLWDDGSTGQFLVVSTTGNYSVSVTDNNGCIGVDDITVTVNATVSVDLGSDQSICEGQSVQLNPGTFNSYLWSTGVTSQTLTVSFGVYSVTVSDAAGCSASDTIEIILNPTPPTPTITASGYTTICEGESVTLSAPAGYNYMWSNGETSESIIATLAGNYSVAVADLVTGCPSLESAITTVTINPLPAVDLGADTTVCDGGLLVLDGGMFDSYLWSDGSTDQTLEVTITGVYSLSATLNGCVGVDEVSITFQPGFTIDLGIDSTFCEGMEMIIDAGAGFDYLWSTGETTQTISVLVSGDYSVIVNDNGCTATDTVEVTVNPTPMIDLGGDQTITANSLVLDAGVQPNYLWSTGDTVQTITVNTSEVFAVLAISDLGCVGVDTVSITFVSPITFIVDDSQGGDHTGFFLKGSWDSTTGEFDANWSGGFEQTAFYDDGTNGDEFANDHIWTAVQNLVIDNGANTWEWGINDIDHNWIAGNWQFSLPYASPLTVTYIIVGINDLESNNLFSVYPNPNNGIFNIEIENSQIENVRIELINAQGQIVYFNDIQSVVSHKEEVDASSLAQGVYYVKVISGSKVAIDKLIIK